MMENQVEMFKVATSEGVTFDPSRMEYSVDPYWKLEVEREHMLEQTLSTIKRATPSDLRKKLRVVLKGEDHSSPGGTTGCLINCPL